MKKALIASTALVLTAGVAAADVTISGYGRTGVQYYENTAADDADGLNESQIISRLRMNIDASTSTDQGIDFGARFRMQWDQNSGSRGRQAELNAGVIYITASGLTVSIGNVGNAYDDLSVVFGSELGSYDTSVGAVNGNIFAYNTGPYGSLTEASQNRSGVAAKYEIADFTVRASYIDPDQSGLDEFGAGEANEEEYALSVAYTWNDRLDLEAAYVTNGAGFEDNDIWYVGGRYAVMDNANVGVTYVSTDDYLNGTTDIEGGDTILLFGDYTLADGMTNIEAFVGNNNADGNETDNAFGVGVNYDLGGARLGASLQRDYDERVYADMGVRFDF
ncbi:porin [Paracoccus nototheniae]|uniref:Porin n=1 Tax=Paracoccus nototheniae TaxID=2489002 RepID=A0ABW4E229_9RHOB|nr:porin [Paracoccus nototheniae]